MVSCCSKWTFPSIVCNGSFYFDLKDSYRGHYRGLYIKEIAHTFYHAQGCCEVFRTQCTIGKNTCKSYDGWKFAFSHFRDSKVHHSRCMKTEHNTIEWNTPAYISQFLYTRARQPAFAQMANCCRDKGFLHCVLRYGWNDNCGSLPEPLCIWLHHVSPTAAVKCSSVRILLQLVCQGCLTMDKY